MPNKQLSENLQKVAYGKDPTDLYRQAAREVQARNSGLERYVIGIFGPNLMGSIALAFDPYRQFYNNPRQAALLSEAKYVRNRTFTAQFPQPRKERWQRVAILYDYYVNPQGGFFTYVYRGPVRTTTSGTVDRGDSPLLVGTIRDTTRATRPKRMSGGEFELFYPRLHSVSKSVSNMTSDNLTTVNIGNGQRVHLKKFTFSQLTGPEFTTTNSSVQAMLPAIRTRALAAMQKNVYDMLDKVQPRHKTFDLAYQIAELRDLPRTLQGTLQVWMSFERLVGTDFFRTLQRSASSWRNPDLMRAYARNLGRSTGFDYNELASLSENASSAFLTFKFGWESTVRGIVEFLPSPSRVTKQVNLLVDSIGKDRTFRTKKSWIEDEASFPNFITAPFYKDEDIVSSIRSTSGTRKIELRLTANFRIQFPHLDLPRLRGELFARRLGIEPSPSDIYNLIPWTWLVDWFGGLGDYVTLMDTIGNEKSLINYAYLTYVEESEARITMRGEYTTTVTRTIDGNSTSYSYKRPNLHEGRFLYKYQLRRYLPSIASSVKTIWGQNLNLNQQAIIGALLSTRAGSAARRDAS